jgi:hypothetical protein
MAQIEVRGSAAVQRYCRFAKLVEGEIYRGRRRIDISRKDFSRSSMRDHEPIAEQIRIEPIGAIFLVFRKEGFVNRDLLAGCVKPPYPEVNVDMIARFDSHCSARRSRAR